MNGGRNRQVGGVNFFDRCGDAGDVLAERRRRRARDKKREKTEEAKRPGKDSMNVRASQAAAHVTWANLRPRLAASALKGVPEVSCVRVSCQRAVNTYLLLTYYLRLIEDCKYAA